MLVAVEANLHATRRPDLERNEIELVVVELNNTNSKPVILYTFYRRPVSGPEVFHHLNSSLQNTGEPSCIVLAGDFNLPALDWTTFDEQIPATTGGQPENSFCDLFDDNFLQQFILGPTHNCGNKLDLLLSITVLKLLRMLKHLITKSANFQPIIISSNFKSNLNLSELGMSNVEFTTTKWQTLKVCVAVCPMYRLRTLSRMILSNIGRIGKTYS